MLPPHGGDNANLEPMLLNMMKMIQPKMKSTQPRQANHANPKDHALIVERWATSPLNTEEAPESTTWMPIKEKTKSLL